MKLSGKLLRAAVFTALFFGVSGFSVFSQEKTENGELEAELAAETLLQSMSDQEMLAQTFMFAWTGASPSPLILEWIRSRRIGGVKVFGWNVRDIETLARTIGTLQKEALAARGIPLLVATDQEGGIVRHIKDSASDMPGNMAIGAGGYPEDAYRSGLRIGRELSLIGVNMNFAPVLDLATSRDSELIGPRSFGSDPVKAGILGAAFMKGQAASGVISTAKHFPGHGGTNLDSHGILPRIDAAETTLWERELVPYRILIKEGLPAIMSGHLAFPNTPAGNVPASLSPWFLTGILRKRMGYRGLIITDDLLMYGAVQAGGSLPNTVREALLAGNDMILVSSTPGLYSPLWTALSAAMKTDRNFRARVRDAARRVLVLKLSRLASFQHIPDIRKLEAIPAQSSAPLLGIAARGTTLVRNEDELIPLDPRAAGRVLLAGQYPAFFAAGKKAFPLSENHVFDGRGSPRQFQRRMLNADTIIFCLAGGDELRFLETLRTSGKKVIVISALNPVYLDRVPWAGAVIAVYGFSAESFTAGFSALLGRFTPKGQIP